MGSLWRLWSFADPVDTGYQSAGKHVHDRSSSFAGRLGLDGNVATAAANGVVHAESVCPRATAEEQKPEYDAADHRIECFRIRENGGSLRAGSALSEASRGDRSPLLSVHVSSFLTCAP